MPCTDTDGVFFPKRYAGIGIDSFYFFHSIAKIVYFINIINKPFDNINLPKNLKRIIFENELFFSLDNLPMDIEELIFHKINVKLDNLPINLKYIKVRGNNWSESLKFISKVPLGCKINVYGENDETEN